MYLLHHGYTSKSCHNKLETLWVEELLFWTNYYYVASL